MRNMTETNERISVIIPVYNAGQWLEEALRSLQSQTYPHFEGIIVNDGSTDNSVEICRRFVETDSRFRLINQDNQGLSGARNTGLENTTGIWISCLDADDVLPAESLETMISLAHEYDSDIVTGRYLRGNPERLSPETGISFTLPPDDAIIMGLYQKRILNSACGKLFRADIFKGDPPLRFRKCWYEDLDIFYRAFECVDKICITDTVVYYYRDTPGSFINTWKESRLDALEVTDRILKHMKTRSKPLADAARDRRFSAHFNILVEMLRNGVDNTTQTQRCWRVIKNDRWNELRDKNVRLKNKLGALVSYLGMPVIRLLCKY